MAGVNIAVRHDSVDIGTIHVSDDNGEEVQYSTKTPERVDAETHGEQYDTKVEGQNVRINM